MAMPQIPKWYDDDGQIVSCTEKVKVMTENLNELYQIAQDAFEKLSDGLFLLGRSSAQLLTFHHAHRYRYGFFLQGNGQAGE